MDLASSYFHKGQRPNYLRRCNVSRVEFGMESKWGHCAIDTRNAVKTFLSCLEEEP